MAAAADARLLPKGFGDRTHAARRRQVGIKGGHGGADRLDPRCRHGGMLPVDWIGEVTRMGGHHERPRLCQHRFQRLDDRHRATTDPAQGAQGGMDQQRHPLSEAKGCQINDQTGYSHWAVGGFGNDVGFAHILAPLS